MTKVKGVRGGSPSTVRNLLFRRALAVAQCASAGQLTGQRTIGELLSLKKEKTSQSENVRRTTFAEVTPLTTVVLTYFLCLNLIVIHESTELFRVCSTLNAFVLFGKFLNIFVPLCQLFNILHRCGAVQNASNFEY